MIIEQKIIKEIETVVKTYYCDVCGVEIEGIRAYKCGMCGKHLCQKCIGHEESFCTDYPDRYCHKCWNIGIPFRDQMDLLEIKMSELHYGWVNECKK